MGRSPFVVGIDPALNGAAVLLDGGRARIAWTWKQVQRSGFSVFRLATIRLVGDVARATARTVPTLGMVGEAIAADLWNTTGSPCIRLFAEATHVRFVTAAISIEGSAGRVLGPIERYTDGWTSTRIKASEWRRLLLRMASFTGRDAAKLAAERFVPPLVPGLDALIERLRLDLGSDRFDPEHLYDAAGVAACGARHGDDGWPDDSKRTRRPSPSGPRGSKGRRAKASAA